MATKKKYTGPRAFDGQLTRAMPEDITIHSTLTAEDIQKLPVIEWNQTKQQWEIQGEN
jgi:hypothetical protein